MINGLTLHSFVAICRVYLFCFLLLFCVTLIFLYRYMYKYKICTKIYYCFMRVFFQYYSSCCFFNYTIFTGCVCVITYVECVSVWVCFWFAGRNKTNNLKRICCGKLWSRLDKPCEIAAFFYCCLFPISKLCILLSRTRVNFFTNFVVWPKVRAHTQQIQG